MSEVWRSAAGWADAAKSMGINKKVFPHSERNIREKAVRDGWNFRDRTDSGGGREFPLSALPKAFQNAFARHHLRQTDRLVPAQLNLELPRIEDMKTYQRKPLEARAALLAEIDRMVIMGLGRSKAIETLVEQARLGQLSPDLQGMVSVANARGGIGRTMTRSTIYNWMKAREQAGGRVEALAPAQLPGGGIPDWAQTFIELYCRPSKPGIAEVLDDAWPDGVTKPSYDQVRRFLKKVDVITKNRGRVGPKGLQQFRAYHKRDVSDLWPGAVFIGDGHTHKAMVAHPLHGQPFRPEITSIVDVYSRRWVGWSAALAENTWSVADALRHAVTSTTICDVFYYDNGSGAKNLTWDDNCTGLIARLGIVKLHSAPWSSQARGVIERFHSSVLHRVARRSPSYVGSRMDDEARQAAYKITKKDLKISGQSKLLPLWSDFALEIDAEMERYNNRPHDSLPKIIDPASGKRRHMTPNEVWQQAIDDGWQADPISQDDARSLFRPAIQRKTNRSLVSWIGNEYYHEALEALHGEDVVVSYDIHDAQTVDVSLLDGRFICTAVWDGHKTSYTPVSFVQHVHDQRTSGRLKRHDAKREKILLEATPNLSITHQPAQMMPDLTEDQRQAVQVELNRLEAPTAIPTGHTIFPDDASWVQWCINHKDEITESDRRELRRKISDRMFMELMGMQGLDVGALQTLAA